ncbi:MAG: aminoacyl-tRNA hydrolase [Hyphomicrobium sp.]
MKLFVGLGNPGEKYASHRHNIGFRAVDHIAETYHFPPWKKKFKGLLTEGIIGETKVILLKPQTYMNESGQSVGEAARFYNFNEKDILIFHDELDLPSGKVKVKIGGGNAGHNGLRSITAHVGNETVRVRLGIGHPGSKEAVAYYVLSDFPKKEAAFLEHLLNIIAKNASYLTSDDLQGFMNKVSSLLNTPNDKANNSLEEESACETISSKKEGSLKSTLKGFLRRRKPTQ